MTYYIERDFPIEQLNPLARREAISGMTRRPYQLPFKWWARRVGCVFRTMILAETINIPLGFDLLYIPFAITFFYFIVCLILSSERGYKR